MRGEGRWWWAIWESGAGAALDGVTALHGAGLRNFDDEDLHISVPSANRSHRLQGVTLHRLNDNGPLIRVGIPRVEPHRACLRAAAWARSDRQAALLIAMSIQQRIVQPARLRTTWADVGYTHRRAAIDQAVRDGCDGAQSLGELDFAVLCRQYGLPEPSRQLHRCRPNGSAYVDAGWDDVGLLVEIDGAHHGQVEDVVADALRQNDLVLGDERVLRIPLFGLRHQPDTFMKQVVRAYRTAAHR